MRRRNGFSKDRPTVKAHQQASRVNAWIEPRPVQDRPTVKTHQQASGVEAGGSLLDDTADLAEEGNPPSGRGRRCSLGALEEIGEVGDGELEVQGLEYLRGERRGGRTRDEWDEKGREKRGHDDPQDCSQGCLCLVFRVLVHVAP